MNTPAFFTVKGGPGDGARLDPAKLVPLPEDGGMHRFVLPDDPHNVSLYRRTGDVLTYVGPARVCLFVGGPFDGCNYPEEMCPGEASGVGLIVPLENGRYALYRRKGRRLEFDEEFDDVAEAKRVDEPPGQDDPAGLRIL